MFRPSVNTQSVNTQSPSRDQSGFSFAFQSIVTAPERRQTLRASLAVGYSKKVLLRTRP